ncbi:MAG: hypothetical protein A2X49_15910 [Lentisphaerae bacterium GWF2_52_8]|nr:MAG: hypothetical protein A2X49_15910 [Lentisphaerae bacterium GWF2_52_8]
MPPFTLIELLAIIGIIGILASLLLPVLGKAREQGKSISCLSKQRQIGSAFMLYLSDNRGFYPPNSSSGNYLYELLDRYLGEDHKKWPYGCYAPAKSIFICPSNPMGLIWNNYICPAYANYGCNGEITYWIKSFNRVKNCSGIYLLLDYGAWGTAPNQIYGGSGWCYLPGAGQNGAVPSSSLANAAAEKDYWFGRHGLRAVNVLYTDGHTAKQPIKTMVDEARIFNATLKPCGWGNRN